MLGGFLGAGKTTALIRLARHYVEAGLRVGIITNDQAEGLVDTLAYREAGYTTEEIPSGCFCCHFEKLLEASGRLADGLEPDIILAEPVGSCTDLVNAVITPLRRLYTDRFEVAPYAVLLDPFRAEDALSASGPTALSKKVTYLYKMQQNEADVIVVNKVDQLDADARERVAALVAQNFPKAKAVFVSALTGAGFGDLVPLLSGTGVAGANPAEVVYARYTEAEIALGWLNARFVLEAAPPRNVSGAHSPWDGNEVLKAVARSVREMLVLHGAQIAHFKMRLIDPSGREAALHATRNDETPMLTRRLKDGVERAALVINLRAEGSPDLLERSVRETMDGIARERQLRVTVERCDAFAPNPPVPPPPERNSVRASN